MSETLKGLTPGRLYHFRLVAKNEKGSAEGADETFTTTSPPGPPTAMTGEAMLVGETGATLKGTVNPDGKPTKYLFEWGTSKTYGQVTTEVPVGEDHTGHVASATLTALSPGTVYHFRLVAKNTSSEIVPGAEEMFTIASPLAPLSPPANPSPPTATPSSTTLVPTTTPMTSTEPLPGSPLVGGAKALKLAGSQHGSSVHGSVQVSQAGVGGRLEVDLLASGASLAKVGHSAQVRVGRLVRSSLYAGTTSFTVPLAVRARHALSRRHKLALMVEIVLKPTHGSAATITRSVVLHA